MQETLVKKMKKKKKEGKTPNVDAGHGIQTGTQCNATSRLGLV